MSVHQDEQRAFNEGWNAVINAWASGYHAPYSNIYDSEAEHVAYRDGFYEAVDQCRRLEQVA